MKHTGLKLAVVCSVSLATLAVAFNMMSKPGLLSRADQKSFDTLSTTGLVVFGDLMIAYGSVMGDKFKSCQEQANAPCMRESLLDLILATEELEKTSIAIKQRREGLTQQRKPGTKPATKSLP